jgi:putative ABC transport system permease protein
VIAPGLALRPLSLIRLLLFRPLFHNRGRTLITILGVALGVAAALAIRLANEGVLDSFRASLDHVVGKSRLQVSAGDLGFDEMVFPAIAAVPGVRLAAPIIQSFVPLVGRPGEALLVLGVDVLGDGKVREYRGASQVDDPLRLLTDPDAILLTGRYAAAHRLAIGDSIALLTPRGPKAYVVRGVLADQGAALTLDGQFAVMDIAAAQLDFGKLGRLDRVDLVLEPGADPDRVAAAVRRVLPPGLTVARPENRNRQVEQMLDSFQLNLFVLSLIALFVGAFVVYNTMAVSVIRQRRQIGILRGLGVSRRGILLLIGGEGATIGLLGSLAGAGLGILLAQATLGMVSRTVSSLYAFVRPGGVAVPATTLIEVVLLASGMALVSALFPALEATRVPPREDLAGASLERRHRPGRVAALGLALGLLAWGLSGAGPVHGKPLFGYGAALALLLAATLLSPAALLAFQHLLRPALSRSRLVGARLAATNLGRALRRQSVTVSAILVGLAMLVSVSTMIHSFRRTVEVWIEQTIRADLYLSSGARFVRGADARLPEGLLPALRQIPGVADADGVRTIRVPDEHGGTFILGAGNFDLLARRGRLLFRQGDSASILQHARAADQIIVSEVFAERYRVKEGDEVALPAPGGPLRLRVAGVYYDYTTEGGLAFMDRSLFQRLWRDPWLNSLVVYLAPGADPDRVRTSILQRFADRRDLVVLGNRDLRRRILEIFDQTFAITYGLEAIALVVAVLGVLNTLLASVLERTREIGILRSVGVTRAGVLRSVLWEAAFIGALGDILGTLAGLGLALILVYVINKQSFGWTIQFALPIRLLVEYAFLTLGASLLAGLFPAWRASRLTIIEAVRYE